MAGRVGLEKSTVVAVAADIADKEGLHNLTLAKVAARLGVKRQSLYAHLAGQDGLQRELHLLRSRLLAERVTGAMLGLAGRDALAAYIEQSIAFDLAHPGLMEASRSVPPQEDGEAWAGIHRVLEPLSAVLRSYGLADDELVHWHRTISSAIHGYATYRAAGMLTTFRAPQEETVELIVETFAGGLERARAVHVDDAR